MCPGISNLLRIVLGILCKVAPFSIPPVLSNKTKNNITGSLLYLLYLMLVIIRSSLRGLIIIIEVICYWRLVMWTIFSILLRILFCFRRTLFFHNVLSLWKISVLGRNHQGRLNLKLKITSMILRIKLWIRKKVRRKVNKLKWTSSYSTTAKTSRKRKIKN